MAMSSKLLYYLIIYNEWFTFKEWSFKLLTTFPEVGEEYVVGVISDYSV